MFLLLILNLFASSKQVETLKTPFFNVEGLMMYWGGGS